MTNPFVLRASTLESAESREELVAQALALVKRVLGGSPAMVTIPATAARTTSNKSYALFSTSEFVLDGSTIQALKRTLGWDSIGDKHEMNNTAVEASEKMPGRDIWVMVYAGETGDYVEIHTCCAQGAVFIYPGTA